MTEPLVSILTPVFNGERFLDAAVRSVVMQTYRNWELLLADDGSTDGSWLKIESWVRADMRIKAVAHPGYINRGVSATRNLALTQASGKYVALLDCDDEWLPEKLERQVRILQDNPEAVLAYSKAVSIDETGAELACNPQKIPFPPVCGTGLPSTRQAVIEGLIGDTVWMPTLTVIMKTAEVRAVGGFDEEMAASEDHLLFTQLVARGDVCFTDTVLARYRVHAASCTQTTPWMYSMLQYYDKLYDKFPCSARRLIVSAKSRFIANRLVGKPSESLGRQQTELKQIVIDHVADNRVNLRGKLEFIALLVCAMSRKVCK